MIVLFSKFCIFGHNFPCILTEHIYDYLSAPDDIDLLTKVFATVVGYTDDVHAILQITSKVRYQLENQEWPALSE